MLKLAIILLTWLRLINGDPNPIVSFGPGQNLEGKNLISSYLNVSFHSFLGIPYAIKPNRFEYAQPAPNWTGTKLAHNNGYVCPQQVSGSTLIVGDEDCLWLNVNVPKRKKGAQKYPVLVFFHGGGFVIGTASSNTYGPEVFMNFKVVLVLVNFRLGICGSLCINNGGVYGNQGLMDQRLALQWVQDNIEKFGGDKTKVTIFGESAGAASVMLHAVSPLSQGLFHKVIAQSGSCINDFSVIENAMQYYTKIGNDLGCDTSTTATLINCFKTKSAYEIVSATSNNSELFVFRIQWGACIESPGGPGFLTTHPHTILVNNNTAFRGPILIGANEMEGYLITAAARALGRNLNSAYFDSINGNFGHDLSLVCSINPTNYENITNIKNYYCNNYDLDNQTLAAECLSKIVTDCMFTVNISETADLLSENQIDTYVYLYKYLCEQHCYAKLFGSPCGLYAGHADELFMLFKLLNTTMTDSKDVAMSMWLTALWVTFATTSNDANFNSIKYNSNDPKYTELDFEFPPTVVNSKLTNNGEFWSTIKS